MNGASNYEENKTRPVMNSIALAFSSGEPENNRAPAKTPTYITATGSGDSLEELEGLFNAHMAGFKASRNRLGTVMHVQTSIGQFENAIDVNYDEASLGEKGSFIMTMVTLLRSKKKGSPYRVDMVINIPDDPAILKKQNPDEFMRKLKRVSGFAKTLEQAGLPKKMISAGLAKGEAEMIDLYFYRYKPINLPPNIVGGL